MFYEKTIEKYLHHRVRKLGGVCYKFISSISGIPDRVAVLCGVTIFVELKADKNVKLSALQKLHFWEISEAGGQVAMIFDKPGVDEPPQQINQTDGQKTTRTPFVQKEAVFEKAKLFAY